MSLWIGTYARNGGKGLHPLSIATGSIEVGPPEPGIPNASYGVWSERHRLAYFVDEQDAGRVTAWHYEDGRWSQVSETGSGGGAPCYLALSPKEDLLAVANYADGMVALLPLNPTTGEIGALADATRLSGRGVDPERQAGPHAHCALFSEDGTWLYQVDLGLDQVLAYPVERQRLGGPEIAFAAPPGSGPRHLLFLPDRRRALLIRELSAEPCLLERHGPAFTAIAREPTSSRKGENLGGHLALLDQDRVAVTNRGHDDLTVFQLGQTSLDRQASYPTQGSSPRQFWSDGRVAIVANEESSSVTLLRMVGPDMAPVTAEVPGACFIFEIPEEE